MLERLRGAASASEPRTQKAIYELGFSVLNPVLVLLEVYKHEVYIVFSFVCDSLLISQLFSMFLTFLILILPKQLSQNLLHCYLHSLQEVNSFMKNIWYLLKNNKYMEC